MQRLHDIKQQISELSREEFSELCAWLIGVESEHWDRQIEADIAAGKLDALIVEAWSDYSSGRSRLI